ncbi:MAG: glycosyltransferase family 4 protein [Parcubacteria group bacterium]|nr:glycosyltransferase family 4 protein [Parcubacteria group bacterium]MBI2636765.1 glycosyltransferase family 4 protein [Parcubacteria group bacterium]
MRIGIDCRVLQEGTGGVFGYAKSLLHSLIPQAAKHEIKLFANQHRPKKSAALVELAAHPNVALNQYTFPNKFLNASFRVAAWPKIDELVGGCDVLFFPSMMYAAWSPKTKIVLTMHDLSYEFFPEFFTYRQRAWHYFMNPRLLCQKAEAIIAVSESTRADVISQYGIDGRNVTAIHSGVDSAFRPVVDRSILAAVRNQYGLPDARYILQTGTLEPRKNHLATLAAYEAWRTQYPAESQHTHLLFAGHSGWKARSWRAAIANSEFRGTIHVISDVARSDLPAVYSLASVFVYPSFYEGFGFPVLEAFACGIPVVASSAASVGEIAGDAALLVNPHRVDELLFAIREILNKPARGKELRAKGLGRTTQFGWEKSAKQTLSVLEYAHRN